MTKIPNKWVEVKTKDGKILKLDMNNNKTTAARCGCTGAEPDNAPHFIYDEKTNTLDCEHCHNRSNDFEVITTFKKEWELRRKRVQERAEEKRQNTPLQLVEAVYDWETGLRYYRLNKRIEPEEWDTIKQYFTYYNGHEFQDYEGTARGWMCSQWDVEVVEKTLGITETINKHKQSQEKAKQERHEKSQEKQRTKTIVRTMFHVNGEKIPQTDLTDLEAQAEEIIDDPEHSFKDNAIYGGGRKWILLKDEIVQIENNGRDGDDWSMNNITTGGAGAIGTKIKRNKQRVDILHKYAALFQTENMEESQ